jgi:hypothetical protein
VVLQDVDVITPSTESTSVLSNATLIGSKIVGYGSSPSRRDPATQAPRMGERSPGSRTQSFRTCQCLRPRRAVGTLALSRSAMSPSVGIKTSAPGIMTFAAQWLAYALPCRRFACALASANARLGADVDRYSFIASDLHRLLLAGLPANNPLSSTRKSAPAGPLFRQRPLCDNVVPTGSQQRLC